MTYTRKQFADARRDAETIMANCRNDALFRWRKWLTEHPGVDVEKDEEAGEAVGAITQAVVMELVDHAIYRLAALPEIWEAEADDNLVGEAWPDQTLRGVIRLAVAAKLGEHLDAHSSVESVEAQQLLDDIKAETLEMFRRWANDQPPEAVNMHTGDIPDAVWEGWKIASEVLSDLTASEIRDLAVLPEVWTWKDDARRGATLEDTTRAVLDYMLRDRAWDWLKASQATQPA